MKKTATLSAFLLVCGITGYAQPYCTPEGLDCSSGDGPNYFRLAGEESTEIAYDNTECNADAYYDYSGSNGVKLYAGNDYSFDIQSGMGGQVLTIWIDLDNSGTFDDVGRVTVEAGFSDTMTTLSMAIPSSAVPGTYRMRVLGVYNGDSGGGLSALYPMRPCNLDENDSTVYKYGKTLDFFVEIAEDPLPVKLGRFTAIAKAGAVYLEWTTFSETENKGFYIERSPDGKAWSVLGFVKGKAGMTPLDYNYMDSSPLAGLNIYRLRQMDFNGGIDYSPVIKIVLDEKGKDDILVYPNPATRYITVEGLRGNERISLFNASGSLILQRQAGAGKELMDLLPLDSGVYFLQVSDIYGRRKMKQVMKQGE